ncbi:ATP-binding cassette domain-containing protein, partial [Salmonella sp. SAL4437]|uniref:ATP-binding cassette domain-containing protein n=1 Tax=Salmonella sp. SAL4437 TaxID=3159892 RepID=UPI00397D08ED
LQRFALGPYAGDTPEALSGGFRRRLMIARALVHRPRLLFLDEPTTGLDPQARVAVWDLVNGLRAEGLGIVLTTHYMDEAERLSDALTVL